MTRPSAIVGWDIGGVNTKAARLVRAKGGPTIRWVSHPYEVQHRPEALSQALTEVAGELDVSSADLHAVTMTAELSQAFRTKREGVATVLDALETSFPGASLHVCTVEGRFVGTLEARALPLAVAAANWAATAHLIARSVPTCILIDIGTTSTDLIPIVNGKVVAEGSTDPARLLSGELVYTGALRTPVEAVASRVPLWGGSAGVSADGFALIGDAHLWLGRLRSEDYTCPTPDSRPPTREFAGERLARTVCADREMLDDSDIHLVATALVEAQVRSVAKPIQRIRQRWPDIRSAVVAGIGDFIAAEAACATGLSVVPLSKLLGTAARIAPAAAVAWLLWHHVESSG